MFKFAIIFTLLLNVASAKKYECNGFLYRDIHPHIITEIERIIEEEGLLPIFGQVESYWASGMEHSIYLAVEQYQFEQQQLLFPELYRRLSNIEYPISGGDLKKIDDELNDNGLNITQYTYNIEEGDLLYVLDNKNKLVFRTEVEYHFVETISLANTKLFLKIPKGVDLSTWQHYTKKEYRVILLKKTPFKSWAEHNR